MRTVSTRALCILVLLGCVSALYARKDPSPSVSRRLESARSIALTLQADIAQLGEVLRDQDEWGMTRITTDQLRGDVQVAEGGARELAELRAIASPSQERAIPRVTSLLRELAGNARDIIDHLSATECASRPDVCEDYITGHREIADHLVTLIVEEVDRTRR